MFPKFNQLGFGFLRLPCTEDNNVDLNTTAQMVDLFLQRGYRYFDTAYTYLDGMSEAALGSVLVKRHPRDSFMIATKLPCSALKKGKTPQSVFDQQLRRCGVDYFDVYLLHGLDGEDADYAEEQGCFAFLEQLKRQGKARYTGFSFHDTADVLDRILTRHPEVDVVQIQLNYLDWDNPIIQSGACYEVCRKHNKPIIVMEPVKGGTLANVTEDVASLFSGEAPAHRAIRFAASQEGVALVLSGMSTLQQMEENTRLMEAFAPLTEDETKVLKEAAEKIRSSVAIPCTGCTYCTRVCPLGIPIPQYFSLYNERQRDGWQVNTEGRYDDLTQRYPRASSCIGCQKCQQECPQKIPVADFMQCVSGVFDPKASK